MQTALLVFFVGFVIFAVYYFLRHAAVKRIVYTRCFVQNGVFEGETAELIEEISNRSFMPLVWVDVESFLPAELALAGERRDFRLMQRFISRFNIAPFTKIKRTISIDCTKRGDYKLETVSVRFLLTHIYIGSKTRLYVYPQAKPQSEKDPLQTDAQSQYLAERKLIYDPFSFAGIRDYRRGDPFRSINFKATAKNRTLMVNTREFISVRNFMIYIDFHGKIGVGQPENFEELMEDALSYSADLLQKAIQSGCAAGFAANCRLTTGERFVNYPMGAGFNHYSEILTEMAKIRLVAGNSLTSVLLRDVNKLKNAEIFIYTADSTQDFGGCLDAFRAMGNMVSLIEIGG